MGRFECVARYSDDYLKQENRRIKIGSIIGECHARLSTFAGILEEASFPMSAQSIFLLLLLIQL
jgi:hypothetical protein